MKYPYLASSLPMLVFGAPPATRLEDFVFSCMGVLSTEDYSDLQCLAEARPEATTTSFGQCWCALETQLRNAVATHRAAHWHADARSAQHTHSGYSVFLERAVTDAFTKENPLEREKALDRTRWQLLDDLCAEDPFGSAAVLGHAIRLRIAERWSNMQEESGRKQLEELVDRLADPNGEMISESNDGETP